MGNLNSSASCWSASISAQCLLDLHRINVQGVRGDVHEDGPGSSSHDGTRGRKKAQRSGNDFVTRTNPDGRQREPKGIGSRGAPDGRHRSREFRQLLFKSLDLSTQNEVL